ncbi:MAG: helix-turn-helix transcriptional regulator [Phycisphaerae bacterium]|nr:helix-turn-helix transcriptional regulator [Phycisphaerae bacterium]
MKDDDLDQLFAALAHPARRRMLDLLRDSPGVSIAALADHFDMSAVAVLKHVRVLERAGLVHAEKHGREKHLFFNAVPIQLVYDRWTDQYSQFWAARLADLKERIESRRAKPATRKGARSA